MVESARVAYQGFNLYRLDGRVLQSVGHVVRRREGERRCGGAAQFGRVGVVANFAECEQCAKISWDTLALN